MFTLLSLPCVRGRQYLHCFRNKILLVRNNLKRKIQRFFWTASNTWCFSPPPSNTLPALDKEISQAYSEPPLTPSGGGRAPGRKTSVFGDEEDAGLGLCGWLLTSFSMLLVLITLPFSLCVCFKVRPSPSHGPPAILIGQSRDAQQQGQADCSCDDNNYNHDCKFSLCPRWCRSTRGPSSSGWADCPREGPRVQVEAESFSEEI